MHFRGGNGDYSGYGHNGELATVRNSEIIKYLQIRRMQSKKSTMLPHSRGTVDYRSIDDWSSLVADTREMMSIQRIPIHPSSSMSEIWTPRYGFSRKMGDSDLEWKIWEKRLWIDCCRRQRQIYSKHSPSLVPLLTLPVCPIRGWLSSSLRHSKVRQGKWITVEYARQSKNRSDETEIDWVFGFQTLLIIWLWGARACVVYSTTNQIFVAGQPALFNYSTSRVR